LKAAPLIGVVLDCKRDFARPEAVRHIETALGDCHPGPLLLGYFFLSNRIDSRSAILQTREESVEKSVSGPKPNLKGDILLLDQTNSYPYA
jgi:hypothetical protein